MYGNLDNCLGDIMFGFGKRIKPRKPPKIYSARPLDDYENLPSLEEILEEYLESFKRECEKKRKS